MDARGNAVTPTKRFFTVAEAASLLSLSESTVLRAIREGEFPAIKVRGRYVIPAKAIDAMEQAALTNTVGSADYATSNDPREAAS